MYTKKELAVIIKDLAVNDTGKSLGKFTAQSMIDYVMKAIKAGLKEDGIVYIKPDIVIERVDVPEHEKKLPTGEIVTVPEKVKLKFKPKQSMLDEIQGEKI